MINYEDFKDIKDHLVGLIEDVYQTGNIPDLEFHLENVLVYFGLRLPKHEPVIEKSTFEPLPEQYLHPLKKEFDINIWKDHAKNNLKIAK